MQQTTSPGTPVIAAGSVVHPDAQIGAGVEIGPFCRVGAGVVLGDGVRLISHVSIDGPTRIGAGCVIHPFAALGGAPQHSRHRGELTTLVIEDNCDIREHVSIHRGTAFGRGETRIGAQCLVMAGAHVGHDCKIGARVIIAGQSALGGHVDIGAGAIIGGAASVHQFCRIGAGAIVGGGAALDADLIPFGAALGNRARLGGLNYVGLKRSGRGRDTITDLRRMFRALFVDEAGVFADRIAGVEAAQAGSAEVMEVIAFLRSARHRPILGVRGDG